MVGPLSGRCWIWRAPMCRHNAEFAGFLPRTLSELIPGWQKPIVLATLRHWATWGVKDTRRNVKQVKLNRTRKVIGTQAEHPAAQNSMNAVMRA